MFYIKFSLSNTMKAEVNGEAAKGPDQKDMEVDESYQELYSKNKANKPLKAIEVSSKLNFLIHLLCW